MKSLRFSIGIAMVSLVCSVPLPAWAGYWDIQMVDTSPGVKAAPCLALGSSQFTGSLL